MDGSGFFFSVSGFCSLVYEVVWLRLSMAAFGCNGPMVSIVLSVFMAGLGLGSYLAARLESGLARERFGDALRVYGMCEILIGVGGVVVAPLITVARGMLETSLQNVAWASLDHYLLVTGFVMLILLPWTTVMGATLPIGMMAIRASGRASPRAFSYLYAANLLGATTGTFASVMVLVEHLGFRGTLAPTAVLNFLVGLSALVLGRRREHAAAPVQAPDLPPSSGTAEAMAQAPRGALLLLFLTGLSAMALEIVWVRLYTVYLLTSVYAFAKILGTYLVANFLGSLAYRRLAARRWLPPLPVVLATIGLLGVTTLACTDPGNHSGFLSPWVRLVAGIAPIAFLFGYLTPLLVDQLSQGAPGRAGRHYAVNVIGCIVGPLLASFVLLPTLGEKGTLLILLVPYFVFAALSAPWSRLTGRGDAWALAALGAVLGSLLLAGWLARSSHTIFESLKALAPDARIARDFEATTVAIANHPRIKDQLLVNGYGMTTKTPITKVMAHFPLAALDHPPERALVICFGMGTTFRSAMSWGIKVDAVDLVPGVPKMFDRFHADAARILADPRGRIIIDDGRRFLRRGTDLYDVITLDPPPPIESAASSLLYSVEFYQAAKRRLKPNGILQSWVPFARKDTTVNILKAAGESFAHVRVFLSLEDWGIHLLCSDAAIALPDAAELAARLPRMADSDFVEWGPYPTSREQFAQLLARELPPQALLRMAPAAFTLIDDRPYNEYDRVRGQFPKWWAWWISFTGAP